MRFRPTARQLEYLVALADLRHFGRAARRCAVSQPTLSVQLRQIEQRLGAPLFERDAGPVALTPAGEKAVALAREILAAMDAMAAAVTGGETSLGGRLRLGAAPTFAPYFLPRLLPVLHGRYPDLEIFIREEQPARLEESITEGETDCAMGPDPHQADRLVFVRLMEEELFLGLPADHPLASRPEIPVARLAGERMMTLGRGHRLNENVRALALQAGALLREDYEGTSLDALRQMVSIGMGLTLFPAHYAASEFRRQDSVVLRPLAGPKLTRTIGLFWRRGSVRESHYRILADICMEVAAAAQASARPDP
ncbi:MAG: hydrogen peroxide-inducible genes activator [Zhengella sp.]|uniref:hydrogen peroxide-inducible genes activator n=1 Tax=Zhengella sp. TaxID=2282762 RepID=UPI001E011368|nr:hydrogen peroxide-inducible genes activator [Notoacmeibacter sp.]MCC0026857.1 hydrogen peroxide-inducible genes activator [Brucellaceae bacterium]